MKKQRLIGTIVLLVLFSGSLLFSQAGQQTMKEGKSTKHEITDSGNSKFSPEQAKRVDLTLKRIAKQKKSKVFLRKVTFTEDELNAYLNLIYVKRYTPEVKFIDLELGKENNVSGKVKVLLKGKKYQQVPGFLKDIEVDISGKVECENYRMRVMLEKLKVNGTNFSPEVLDEAFGAAQSGFKIKRSLYDWFQLLPGIKNVVIEKKQITLFY